MSSEAEFRSREMAERARETEWKKASFLRDLFLGSLRLDLVQRAVDDRPGAPSSKRSTARSRRSSSARSIRSP